MSIRGKVIYESGYQLGQMRLRVFRRDSELGSQGLYALVAEDALNLISRNGQILTSSNPGIHSVTKTPLLKRLDESSQTSRMTIYHLQNFAG
jgi:hypothetical protein